MRKVSFNPLARNGAFDARWMGATIDEQHWHFHRQLLERYFVILAPGEFAEIKRALRKGTALMVKKRKNGARIYCVEIASTWEPLYVLAKRDRILTAWPRTKELDGKRRELLAERRAAAPREDAPEAEPAANPAAKAEPRRAAPVPQPLQNPPKPSKPPADYAVTVERIGVENPPRYVQTGFWITLAR